MSNRRLFWKIVDKIEAMINAGDYTAGSRLPPERELAETFGVSRPTIREAIIALEVRGMVEVKTSSGVYVLERSCNGSLADSVNAFEVTQARALVEGEVAAIAAAHISSEDLERLNQTLKDMEQGKSIEEADRKFHHIIANSTRNAAMIYSVENLWTLRASTPIIVEDYDSVCSKDTQQTIEEHRAIYQALQSRDATNSRKAMHNHFNRLINVLFDAEEARALEEIKRKSSEKRDKYSISNLTKLSQI